jgi:L-gulonate 5-dehydrogenase
MKVVRLNKANDIGIENVAMTKREPDQILIKVHSMGICGSDIGAYRGVNPLVTYPRVIGHEVAGEVAELPENETELKLGDRVLLEPYVYCGTCYPCSIGHTNCCENLTVRGVHIEGGMAEYVSHPRKLVHKVPDNLPWQLIPMAEPLVISMHAINQAEAKSGEHVAITGAGQIGLLAAQYALTLGAIPIVIDPVDERLALARSLGVTHTINPTKVDATEQIRAMTRGRMAEVVIEASGAASAIRSAVDYVSYAGRISLVGWPKSDIPLPTALFTKKELTVRGSRNSVGQFPLSLRLISEGKVNVAALLTKTVPFADLPGTVRDISDHPEKYLKVVGLFDQ